MVAGSLGAEGESGGVAGAGGEGGQGGFRGSVLIQSALNGRMLNVHQDSTSQASFLGETIARAPDGPKGNDGTPGKNGKNGERFPDAGLIIKQYSNITSKEPLIGRFCSKSNEILKLVNAPEKSKDAPNDFIRWTDSTNGKKQYITIGLVDPNMVLRFAQINSHVTYKGFRNRKEASVRKASLDKSHIAQYKREITLWMMWARLLCGMEIATDGHTTTMFETVTASIDALAYHEGHKNEIQVNRWVGSARKQHLLRRATTTRSNVNNHGGSWHRSSAEHSNSVEIHKHCTCCSAIPHYNSHLLENTYSKCHQESSEENVFPQLSCLIQRDLDESEVSRAHLYILYKVEEEKSLDPLRSYYKRLKEIYGMNGKQVLMPRADIDADMLLEGSTDVMDASRKSRLLLPADLWEELSHSRNRELLRLIDHTDPVVTEKDDEKAGKSITETERWAGLIKMTIRHELASAIGQELRRAIQYSSPKLQWAMNHLLMPPAVPESQSYADWDNWDDVKKESIKFIANPFREVGIAELEILSSHKNMKIDVVINGVITDLEENMPHFMSEIMHKPMTASSRFIGNGSESTSACFDIDGDSKRITIHHSSSAALELRVAEINDFISQLKRHMPMNTTLPESSKPISFSRPLLSLKFFLTYNLDTAIERLKRIVEGGSEGISNTEVARWLSLLDPKYGLPELLSWFLWVPLQHMATNGIPSPTSEVIFIIRRAIDWMHDEGAIRTLMKTAISHCPHVWRYELLLLKTMQTLESLSMDRPDQETHNCWETSLRTLSVDMFCTVSDRCSALDCLRRKALTGGETDPARFQLPVNDLNNIFEILTHGNHESWNQSLAYLAKIDFNEWLPTLRWAFWQQLLVGRNVPESERGEVLYILSELETKKGHSWCQGLIVDLLNQQTVSLRETAKQEKLLMMLRTHLSNNDHTNSTESCNTRTLNDIAIFVKNSGRDRYSEKPKSIDMDQIVLKINFSKNQDVNANNPEERKTILEQQVSEWVKGINAVSGNKQNRIGIEEFLIYFDKAVEVCKDFRLRDTQCFAIVALVSEPRFQGNCITQVTTGEGKSLIIAALAIYYALSGRTVDIITVNSVLAKRDSQLKTKHGGLRDLYNMFSISVANNCSPLEDERSRAYKAEVVYGEMSAFQRDFLLDSFFSKNIRGNREFDLLFIDEVDSLLIDRENSMLYLSHDIPGMETLEAIYVFIWHCVSNSTHYEADDIKSHIFFDLFGTIKKTDLISLVRRKETAEWTDDKVRLEIVSALWLELIMIGVIDSTGKFLVQNSTNLETMLNLLSTDYKDFLPRLAYYFKKIADRPRQFNIPAFLFPFVERNLDEWIRNADVALTLERDVDYVVDYDRLSSGYDLTPIVTIVDQYTGTDQANSQWDAALHQFVQLKEGCQLTLQSLKAVFVSSYGYVSEYKRILGLSGTLGSSFELNYFRTTYKVSSFEIPTAFPRQLSFLAPVLASNRQEWLEAIYQQTVGIIHDTNKPRSVLIICQSIRDVDLIFNWFIRKRNIKARQLSCFKRDFERLKFESDKLDIGHIIIATCLAGRGTDIKLSDQLRNNGGLHVCTTFLPDNLRMEEQIFGRAGRNGAPGSCAFIVLETSEQLSFDVASVEDPWARFALLKAHRAHVEYQEWVLRSRDLDARAKIENDLLNDFREFYANLRIQCQKRNFHPIERDVYCKSVLDQFALWLDVFRHENVSSTNQMNNGISSSQLNFSKLTHDMLSKFGVLWDKRKFHVPLCPNWITPGRRVQLAKHWISVGGKKKLKEARTILDRLIQSSDAACYPSAHYYSAYLIARSDRLAEEKQNFIQHLRLAERILNEQIQAQVRFAAIHAVHWNRKYGRGGATSGNLMMTFYEKQKKNAVRLLERHLDNISNMLGNWLTPKHFSQVSCQSGELLLQEGQQQQIWQDLIRHKLVLPYRVDSATLLHIVHMLHFDCGLFLDELISLLPDRKDEIKQIVLQTDKSCSVEGMETVVPQANSRIMRQNRSMIRQLSFDYGIDLRKLLEFLLKLGRVSEEQLFEKIKESQMFTGRSRETFWKQLESNYVLDGYYDCLVASRKVWDQLENYDHSTARIKYAADLLMRDRTFLKRSSNQQGNNFIILEKTTVSADEFRRNIIHYEPNKAADGISLEKLIESSFSANSSQETNMPDFLISGNQFTPEEFQRLRIPKEEWAALFKSLVDQDIIDSTGRPRNIKRAFSYPECSYYEKDVAQLVNHVFTTERILLEWVDCCGDDPRTVNQKQTIDRLNELLELVPLHPGHALTADLISLRLILPPSVTDDESIDFDRDGSFKDRMLHFFEPAPLQNLCNNDSKLISSLQGILKMNRASYVGLKKSRSSLKSLSEELIRSVRIAPLGESNRSTARMTTGLASELYILRLNGFDDLFNLEEGSRFEVPRWSVAAFFSGTIKTTVALLSFIPSLALLRPNAAAKLLLEGIFDIAYFARSFTNRKPTLADYVAASEQNTSLLKIVQNIHSVWVANFPSLDKQGHIEKPESSSRVGAPGPSNFSFGYGNKVNVCEQVNFLNSLFTPQNDTATYDQQPVSDEILHGVSRQVPFQDQFDRESIVKHHTILHSSVTVLENEHNKMIKHLRETFQTEHNACVKKTLDNLFSKVSFKQAETIIDQATQLVYGLDLEGLKAADIPDVRFEDLLANDSLAAIKSVANEETGILEKLMEDVSHRLENLVFELVHRWCTAIQSSPIIDRHKGVDESSSDPEVKTTNEIVYALEDLSAKLASQLFNILGQQTLQNISIELEDSHDCATLPNGKERCESSRQISEVLLPEHSKVNNEQKPSLNAFNLQPIIEAKSQYLDSCLQLLKKTNNPAILALILEDEKIRIPADRFIIDAFACILSTVLEESFGIIGQKIAVRVELSSTGECFHHAELRHQPCSEARNSRVYVVAAGRVAMDQSLNQFVEAFAPFGGCSKLESQLPNKTSYDLIDCLAYQINKVHANELEKQVDARELRVILASAISKQTLSSLITDAWKEYLVYLRFSGLEVWDSR